MRLIIAGDGDNGAVEIVGHRFVIGRDTDSDLTLDDSKVSRHHAALRALEDGRVELEDLDSANGTFVNGSRVDKAMLEGGEELQIGRTKLAVERDASPAVDTEETPPPATREAETPFMLQLDDGREIEARGEHFTIGRDPDSDLTLDDSKVSREHAYLNVQPDGRVELHDRSANGSFVDGRRVEGTELLQGGEQLRFGETTIATSRGGARDRLPATKPDLPSMPPPVPPRPPEPDSAITRMQRSLRRTTILAAVAVAVAIGVGAAFAVGAFSGGGGHPRRHAPTRASITQLERATVLINAYDSAGQQLYSGSGSIITPDGLILTNAHVGDPSAEGLAVQEGLDQWESESAVPDKLVVAIFEAEDQPPKETYTAHSVASDGYLDIAVLKIDGSVNGGSVANLHLPTVKLGDSDKLRGEDPIRVVGYPGIGGDNVNDSPGTVFGFLSDPHLTDSRAWIKTGTDVVNAGNSGGLAANAAGRLIGIPSQATSRPAAGERQGRIRPINLAKPIIDAAKSDTPYVSDYLVRKTGNESVTLTDWATDVPDSSCNYQSTTSYASGATKIVAVLSVTGFTHGEDTWVRWKSTQDPTSQGEVVGGDGAMWDANSVDSSCWPLYLTNDQGLSDGTYSVQVFAGPNYDAVGDPITVTVGGTP